MTFGCGKIIAALVTLLFKSNPQLSCLILNIILQTHESWYFNGYIQTVLKSTN
jgi:hypothetical protein